MNDFLDSLKADLLDRRAAADRSRCSASALLGALAYAVARRGGSSTARPTRARRCRRSRRPRASPSAQATTADRPAGRRDDERTAHRRRPARARNPFAPLPGAKRAAPRRPPRARARAPSQLLVVLASSAHAAPSAARAPAPNSGGGNARRPQAKHASDADEAAKRDRLPRRGPVRQPCPPARRRRAPALTPYERASSASSRCRRPSSR